MPRKYKKTKDVKTLPEVEVRGQSNFVTSADDPRYKAYQDSLNLYEKSEEIVSDYNKLHGITTERKYQTFPEMNMTDEDRDRFMKDDLRISRNVSESNDPHVNPEWKKRSAKDYELLKRSYSKGIMPVGGYTLGQSNAYAFKKPIEPIIRPLPDQVRSMPAPTLSRDTGSDRSLIDIQTHMIDPWDKRFGEVPENVREQMQKEGRDKIQLRRSTDIYGNVKNIWPHEYEESMREQLIPYGDKKRKGYNHGTDYVDAIKKRKFKAPLKRPDNFNTNE